jgi:hypothetical protein
MSTVVCSPNAVITFDFLVDKGLRDYQAAAVVGNLQQESGIKPGLSAPDPRPNNPAAMGRGIAMWGDPGRWQHLLAFAADTGRDPWALNTQLEFLWAELPSHGLDDLLLATTLEDAVVVFQNRFEKPSQAYARTDARIRYAKAALLSCPTVNPPDKPRSKIVNTLVAAMAGGALAAMVGFGIYKAQGARKPEPEPPAPRPPPPRPAPSPWQRPAPTPSPTPPPAHTFGGQRRR